MSALNDTSHLCPRCTGLGFSLHLVTDMGARYFAEIIRPCDHCNGMGWNPELYEPNEFGGVRRKPTVGEVREAVDAKLKEIVEMGWTWSGNHD